MWGRSIGTGLMVAVAFLPVAANDQAWFDKAKAEIEKREYDFLSRQAGSVAAANRAQGMRSSVSSAGLAVESRDHGADVSAGGWRLSLATTQWGRPGTLGPLATPSPTFDGGRAVLDRRGVVESWVNDSRGLELLFDVIAPPREPREGGPLVLSMELGGDLLPAVAADGGSILFRSPAGKPVAYLGSLSVVDAGGIALPATFAAAGGRLELRIDDRDAVYPIHVDPLLAAPSWQVESNQAGAFYGLVVSPAGDVNGDGFSDVLIGAYDYDNGQTDEGRVFLYLGSASGLSTAAARTFESNQASAHFGWSISTAGDLNADGFDDFAVGAYTFDDGQTDEGAVFVYTGAASAASIALAKTLEADQASALFGYSLAYGGDVNGDGYSDLVVGAPNWDGGQTNEGAMFVFLGDPTTVIAAAAPFRAESDQASAVLGIAVAGGVDVNADGYDDVFAGASGWDTATLTSAGRVLGFYGSATGLPATPSWTEDGAGGSFGQDLAAVGDTNGDGYADLAIGASSFTNGALTTEGRLYLYRGSSTGLGASAAQTRDGGTVGAQFGSSVAPAGDVNGDGFADVAVGANGADPGALSNAGEVRVFEGSSSGLSTTPSWVYAGDQANSGVGEAVFTAGDVNGDGYSDLIVGAGGYDNGQTDEGRAYVFLGSGDGPVTTPSATLKSSDTAHAENFGFSVASAGDVNADGFSDIIVGDPQYGPADDGAAYIFLGSATGPATTPATVLIGLQLHAAFGQAVGCAGDVNGDGYDDVIVAAPFFNVVSNNHEGRIYVYYGGAAGVDTTSDFEASGTDTFDQNLGMMVVGLGDVDGDGFADIAAGCGISHSSRLYYGSPTGPDANSVRSIGGDDIEAAGDLNGDGLADFITNHNLPLGGAGHASVFYGISSRDGIPEGWSRSGSFGASAHAAGDVDGDGFADVVVSTSGPSGSVRELYFGGPSGLGATADQALSFDPGGARTVGDVNGDGFADLMLYPSSSTMEIRFGSATGYGTAAGWSVTVPTPSLNFGDSFASAGDVNGDGFVDVIVGAPDDSPGGSAIIYLGGGGDGLDFVPHNRRGDNAGPTAFLGNSGSPDRFRITSRGRSARGRALIAMDHQVAPLGTSIGSGTFVHGAYFATGTTDASGADVNFTRLVSGLAPWTQYKWRMRFSTADPIFPRTRWISLPGNGPNEVDVRTTCTNSSWYRDVDGDGYGGYPYQYAVCIQPLGYVAASGDCNDADATMFPGNPELCDGKDNNCNGSVDDGFAAPAGRPAIVAIKSASTATFTWAAIAGADRYDTVRGDVTLLRTSAGNYTTSIDSCLANDASVSTSSDAAVPATADGYWYLIRPVNCTATGSYDETAASQIGSRDPEIAASGVACP